MDSPADLALHFLMQTCERRSSTSGEPTKPIHHNPAFPGPTRHQSDVR